MTSEIDDFSLWIAPDHERITFRGRLIGQGRSLERYSLVTVEVSIYQVVSGGYVLSLSELMPEETGVDDLKRRRALKESYGSAWARSTVTYARQFSSLDSIAESDLHGFVWDESHMKCASRALADALRQATEERAQG